MLPVLHANYSNNPFWTDSAQPIETHDVSRKVLLPSKNRISGAAYSVTDVLRSRFGPTEHPTGSTSPINSLPFYYHTQATVIHTALAGVEYNCGIVPLQHQNSRSVYDIVTLAETKWSPLENRIPGAGSPSLTYL